MANEKPARIKWADEVLSVKPNETLLEIGCGNGHAIELICKRLKTGKVVGVDRSAKAILAAEANNQLCVNSGKAQFVNSALADMKPNQTFDKIFAINVNVFWIDPKHELPILHTLMNRRGQLYLFYEPPSSQLERIIENCKIFLEAADFKVVDVLHRNLKPNHGVYILARK